MIEFIKNLTILESVVIGIAVLFVGRIIWREITFLRLYFGLVKKQKARMKELEENKCKGPHSWIDMEVKGETTHVCKECCYSPKNEGFIRREFIDAHLQEIEYRKAMEKYKKDKLLAIAFEYKIDSGMVEDVYDKMVNIKKDFALEWLDKKLAEMLSDER